MCIRDRPPIEPGVETGAVLRVAVETPLQRVAYYARDAEGAVSLYTSDAADDLLCVDLGGRRIIKKKKIKTRRKQNHKI